MSLPHIIDSVAFIAFHVEASVQEIHRWVACIIDPICLVVQSVHEQRSDDRWSRLVHILNQGTGHLIVLLSHLVHNFARRKLLKVALRINQRLGGLADDLK